MKLVNFYHLAGIVVLILMAVSFSVGFNESAFVWGIGLLVVLVLGAILFLDNLRNQMDYHENRISEISSNIESIKASVEIVGRIFNQDIISRSMTLDEIRKELCRIEEEFEKLKTKSK